MQSATYDHVDDDGNLILTIDGGKQVALAVTDKLEQAIISARQIQSEARAGQRPVTVETLPISRIQTMVREGKSYQRIAEKYKIDETLVRRYAQPVEQEKSYAINQFMAVRRTIDPGLPSDTRGFITQNDRPVKRTIGDLLGSSFARARVDEADVEWDATRFRHEPWRITASFEQNGRSQQATWTWNMRDNSVICMNPAARRLLGQEDDASTILFGDEQHDIDVEAGCAAAEPAPAAAPAQPASAASAPAPLPAPPAPTASAPMASVPTMPTDRQQDSLPTSSTLPAVVANAGTTSVIDAAEMAAVPETATNVAEPDADSSYGIPHYPTPTETMRAARKLRLPGEPIMPASAQQESPEASAEESETSTEHAASSAASQQNQPTHQQKKRHRSAVPSWDEIIFG